MPKNKADENGARDYQDFSLLAMRNSEQYVTL